MDGKDRLTEALKRGVICFTAFCIAVLLSAGDSGAQSKDVSKIRREAERRYLENSRFTTDRINGDYRVDRGEDLEIDLIVTDGDAEIDGIVRGTVIVIDGDIKLGRTGEIRGDAIAISGEIIRDSGGIIAGDEIETSWRNFVDYEYRSTWSERRRRTTWRQLHVNTWFYDDWEREMTDNDFMLRYNRVEGLFLGASMMNPPWDDDRLLYLYGDAGYGFKSKEWRYTVGVERRFFDEHKLIFGVKGYSLTDSDDFWRLGKSENWLASAIIHEDFFDYYNRKGYTAYISQQIDYLMKFQLEYRNDSIEPMENAASWSLFGGSKKFRVNPPFDYLGSEQNNTVNFMGVLDSRNSRFRTNQGWFVSFQSEYTHPDLDSDFDYERYILDVRRYQPLSRYENLNMRLWLGSSKGMLPAQRAFYLGGIGTLRGLKYKEYAGTSMAMANVEYIIDPRRILTGPPSWVLEDFRLALFGDAGVIDPHSDIDDFGDMLTDADWKHNVGIGLLSQDEDFRIDFAWRTDREGDPLRVTFRINRVF